MSKLKTCRCGGEVEIISTYSGAHERIYGFALCRSCRTRVFGKVSFNAMELDTSAPDWPEVKRKIYEEVENGVIEAWNRMVDDGKTD